MLCGEQTSAALAETESPLVVFAGPGAGKTLTLVSRILHILSFGDHGILALTFSRSAANDLRFKLRSGILARWGDVYHLKRVAVSTFHSLAYRIVRECYAAAGFSSVPVVCSTSDAFRKFKELARTRCNSSIDSKQLRYEFRSLMQMPSSGSSSLGDIWSDLIAQLTAENKCLLSSLVPMACQILQKDSSAQHRYRSRYAYIVADEVQDSSR